MALIPVGLAQAIFGDIFEIISKSPEPSGESTLIGNVQAYPSAVHSPNS